MGRNEKVIFYILIYKYVKICNKCNIEKSLEKFYKDSKSLTPLALIKSLIDIKQRIAVLFNRLERIDVKLVEAIHN